MSKIVVCGVVVLATSGFGASAWGALAGVSVAQNSYLDAYQYRGTTFHLHPLLTDPNGSPSQSANDPLAGNVTVTMSGTFTTSATSLAVSTVGTTKTTIDRAWVTVNIDTVTTFSVDEAQQYDLSLRALNGPQWGSFYDEIFTLKANGTTVLRGEVNFYSGSLSTVTGMSDLTHPGSGPYWTDLFGIDQRLNLVPGTTYTLAFSGQSMNDSYYPNNAMTMSASLTVVPEPARGLVGALTAAAMTATGRRRSRR